MLIRHKDLDMLDVISLDKVQKGYHLSDAEFKSLKSKKLIEGRRPKLFVSESVAAETGGRTNYIKNKSFDKKYFKDIIINYLNVFDEADKTTIEDLLLSKVSDAQSKDQKHIFIKNLLQEMRKDGLIKTTGGKKYAKWVLVQSSQKE